MPTLGTCPNKSPPPFAKAWMQTPHGGGKFLCKSLGMCGGMIMDEIDTCITIEFAYHMLQKLIVNKLPIVRRQF